MSKARRTKALEIPPRVKKAVFERDGGACVYGGADAKVRAGKDSVLALQYWKNGEFKGIKFKKVDGVKIKENTYYKLSEAGRFIEVRE